MHTLSTERPTLRAPTNQHSTKPAQLPVVSICSLAAEPTTEADFIEETRTEVMKALRAEITFVHGICFRPEMRPVVALVHKIHAIQQMIDSRLFVSAALILAMTSSDCRHAQSMRNLLPTLRGSLMDLSMAIREQINEHQPTQAALLNMLALSECRYVAALRDAIADGYAQDVGPHIAALKSPARSLVAA